MVRLMDKLWLKEGLDLKMVAFSCIPTGKKQGRILFLFYNFYSLIHNLSASEGMIELVTNAETLRKIHTELGLTGSFKDKPIAEWLAKHNPSELEYQRAVENFTGIKRNKYELMLYTVFHFFSFLCRILCCYIHIRYL